ncbi:MAG: hypothetical protein H7829_11770 [Magnetococcus sp. THC-1_WYH]
MIPILSAACAMAVLISLLFGYVIWLVSLIMIHQGLMSHILGTLKSGDILIADCYYVTYFLIATLLGMGVEQSWKAMPAVRWTFAKDGGLAKETTLLSGANRAAQTGWIKRPTQPYQTSWLSARPEVGGKVLISTFLDPKKATRKELGDLYQMR